MCCCCFCSDDVDVCCCCHECVFPFVASEFHVGSQFCGVCWDSTVPLCRSKLEIVHVWVVGLNQYS